MEGSSEKPAKRQLNIRLSEPVFERLRTWAFLEDGQQPGAFVANLLERVVESVAEADPDVDELVRISAEYRANKQPSADAPES